MSGDTVAIALADEAATRSLGEDLALALKPGDCLALSGELGAGKTTLARALVRAMTGDAGLEVPSPTFTLVQHYPARIPVAHFDLYRLADPSELDELGLDDALAGGVALVEWPERAGGMLPEGSMAVDLADAEGGGRLATVSGPPHAMARLARSLSIRAFLANAGWGAATRRFLLGDASARAYETATLDGETRILMNAPQQPDGPPVQDGKPYSQIAHLAESVTPFVAVGRALHAAGFAAPEIFAADLGAGLLLLENLGSDGILDADRTPIADRYMASVEVVAALHEKRWAGLLPAAPGVSHPVPAYDASAMQIEAQLLLDWYLPGMTGKAANEAERAAFRSVWAGLIDRLDGAERTLVLRDYHSPNIIWRGDRSGHERVGIIDFQDALIGPTAYDVASLAQDARATVSPHLEEALVDRYVVLRHAADPDFDAAAFREEYAIMAAQRATKILGIFVRLDRRDGKPAYLQHLPRMQAYLARCLQHPVLAPYADWCARNGLLDGLRQAS